MCNTNKCGSPLTHILSLTWMNMAIPDLKNPELNVQKKVKTVQTNMVPYCSLGPKYQIWGQSSEAVCRSQWPQNLTSVWNLQVLVTKFKRMEVFLTKFKSPKILKHLLNSPKIVINYPKINFSISLIWAATLLGQNQGVRTLFTDTSTTSKNWRMIRRSTC